MIFIYSNHLVLVVPPVSSNVAMRDGMDQAWDWPEKISKINWSLSGPPADEFHL